VSYWIQLTLRLIHIFAGIFWAGSLLFFARLLGPALRASGGAGDKVSQDLILNRGIGKVIPITAGLTVLSGITMYIRFAMASQGAWPQSRTGIVFGIGGVAGLLALMAGATMIGPSLERVARTQVEAEKAGRALTDAENQLIAASRARAALGFKLGTPLLLVAIAAMAIGRYV